MAIAEVGVLDLRGLCDPEPVIEFAGAAEKLGPGESIEVWSDDPCARAEFVRWCGGAGFRLRILHSGPGFERYRVQRPPGSDRWNAATDD